MKALGSSFYELIAGSMIQTFSSDMTKELTVGTVGQVMQNLSMLYLRALVPVAGILLVVGVAVGLAQSRLNFAFGLLAPNFGRINPITGFSRIFSLRTAVETLKGLLKLTIVAVIVYQTLKGSVAQFPNLMGQSLVSGIATVLGLSLSALQKVGFGLLALGAADYGYQYWEFQKSVRMTKYEVKQELRQQEGNPEVRQRQRQIQREMARRRKAIKDVPKADVVVTNPTHFAVALKYDPDEGPAPKVIAKGTDLLAQQIKSIAKEHEIPMVENRALARTLYSTVEIGDVIPPELYTAVAEVLAFVYSLRRQQRQERTL